MGSPDLLLGPTYGGGSSDSLCPIGRPGLKAKRSADEWCVLSRQYFVRTPEEADEERREIFFLLERRERIGERALSCNLTFFARSVVQALAFYV